MPALPDVAAAATVIVTASSSPEPGSSSSAGDGSESSEVRTPAFTVLPDRGAPLLVCLEGDWQPLNVVDWGLVPAPPLGLEEDDWEESGRHFRASRPGEQSVSAANANLLRRKLMELRHEQGDEAPTKPARIFAKANGYVRPPVQIKVNNLRAQKPLSKSSGQICPTGLPAKKLRKEYSASHSNIHTPVRLKREKVPIAYSGINKNIPTNNKNLLNQNQKEPPTSKCNYHKNCYPTSPTYNMTSAIKPPLYSMDGKQGLPNGMMGMRRKSSPNSDDSLSPFNNNNNINLKNKQNEKNNRLYNNQYSRSMNRLNNGGTPQKEQQMPSKPLFMTTVKSGQFLDPPPELALLLGLAPPPATDATSGSTPQCSSPQEGHRQQVLLYSFSSQPRVLHQHHHRSRCEAAKAARTQGPATAPAGTGGPNGPRVRRDTVRRTNQLDTPRQNGSDAPPPYGNLMFDRRVVRGSTYSQHPVPQPKWNPYFGHARLLSQTDCESQAARQLEARRRALARRRAQGQQTRNARYRLGTPPPVTGRKHEPVQTDKFLEELWEKPTETDIGCQTDLFLDRPASPYYIPAKVGKDANTQILPGELFDFDVEVVPILEVLVGKTVQQAMVEVLEEEELAALREQQRRFLEARAAEEAERRRLEEQEKRLREEKERRMAEFSAASELASDTEARVAAAVLTQGYLADMLPSVLEGLKEAGYLLDDIREDIRTNFMPWLMGEVQQEMNNMVSSRDILMEMVREILEQRANVYRTMGEEDAARLNLESDDDERLSEEQPDEAPLNDAQMEAERAALYGGASTPKEDLGGAGDASTT